jgi:hypothetical protein
MSASPDFGSCTRFLGTCLQGLLVAVDGTVHWCNEEACQAAQVAIAPKAQPADPTARPGTLTPAPPAASQVRVSALQYLQSSAAP